MRESDKYPKIVEWSDEDQVYIGRCPGMFFGGCHGDNEKEVRAELCAIVDEWEIEGGKTLSPATADESLANSC